MLIAPAALTASLHIAWDDHLLRRINDRIHGLGDHPAFRDRVVEAPLRSGANLITIKLSNTTDSIHHHIPHLGQTLPPGHAPGEHEARATGQEARRSS